MSRMKMFIAVIVGVLLTVGWVLRTVVAAPPGPRQPRMPPAQHVPRPPHVNREFIVPMKPPGQLGGSGALGAFGIRGSIGGMTGAQGSYGIYGGMGGTPCGSGGALGLGGGGIGGIGGGGGCGGGKGAYGGVYGALGGMAGMQGGYRHDYSLVGGSVYGIAGGFGGYPGNPGGGAPGGPPGPSPLRLPEDRARQAYEDRYRLDRAHGRPTDTPRDLNPYYSAEDRNVDRPFRLADNDLGTIGGIAGTVLDWKVSGILDLEMGLLDVIAGETLSGHPIDRGDKGLDLLKDFLIDQALDKLGDKYLKGPLEDAAGVSGKGEVPADVILWLAQHAGTDGVKAAAGDPHPKP